MKKTRRAHLWIGLIASVFIFIDALSGLILNEPWLIGQSSPQFGQGYFQRGQFSQGQFFQGQQGNGDFSQSNGQAEGQSSGKGQSQQTNLG